MVDTAVRVVGKAMTDQLSPNSIAPSQRAMPSRSPNGPPNNGHLCCYSPYLFEQRLVNANEAQTQTLENRTLVDDTFDAKHSHGKLRLRRCYWKDRSGQVSVVYKSFQTFWRCHGDSHDKLPDAT
jgi:hypothetical protein